MTGSTSHTYFLRHLWHALTGQRETLDFPEKEPTITSSYQGRLVANPLRCRGCRLCVRACPADAIEVTRMDGGGVHICIYHDRCAMCGLCELTCPEGAVWREARIVPASGDPTTFIETWES